MDFTTLLFDINREREERDIKALLSNLKKNGIQIQYGTSGSFVPADTVLLTEYNEVIARYRDTEITILAYSEKGSKMQDFTGAQMIIEGLEEIDYDFILKQYQRKHDRPWTILETKRCIVREITLEDLDALYEIYREPEITRYMEPLYERSKEEEYTRAYIDHMYRYFGYGMWVIIQKGTNRLIGRAGFNEQVIEGKAETEMGYMIAKDLWRQGYAIEVCRAILDYGREYLEISRIHCLIEPENSASIALAEHLGMTKCDKILLNGAPMEHFNCNLGQN